MPWKDKKKTKVYQAEYRRTHHEALLKSGLEYRRSNRDKIRNAQRRHRLDLKIEAYDAYGGRKCCWCGEDDLFALNIDHMNNDGSKHRDNKGYIMQSSRLYTWLKKNDYPPGFQVLCFNCNYAKFFNGGILPENRKNLHEKI